MEYTYVGKTVRFLAFRVDDPRSPFYPIAAMHRRQRDEDESRRARPSDNHDSGDAEIA